jgi:hypothetical protein
MNRIMYVEKKAGDLAGEARIGNVRFSKTGRSFFYNGKSFSKVVGYKYNCIENGSGEAYWISGCKKNGADDLYNPSKPTPIDEDIREAYWIEVRKQPHLKFKTTSN